MDELPKTPAGGDGSPKELDEHWDQQARMRLDSLTLSPGALGRVGELMVRIVRIQRTENVVARPVRVLIFAGDHGVAREGVSAYPPEATGRMVENVLGGGAAVSVLAAQHRLPLTVVDMGCACEPAGPASDSYLPIRLAAGTKSLVRHNAMTRSQAEQAVSVGSSPQEFLDWGETPRTLLLGELGIGGTTAAAALATALLDRPAEQMVGTGTGIAGFQHEHKVALVQAAAERCTRLTGKPLDLLAAVGGFEIAGLVGALLYAARNRIVVLLDGYVATAAALVADRIDRRVREVCIATHLADETGHDLMLRSLGLSPLLRLDCGLGEATGAALAWPIYESAVRLYREMAAVGAEGP